MDFMDVWSDAIWDRSNILELGCGNGILWKTNQDKIGINQRIKLTDFSEGMLNDAKTVLTDVKGNFEYEVMDAQNITYPDNYFDIVIANLMLYHIPNRKKAFSEITQVLKTDGTFYASTFGRNNMRELNDIFSDYYPQLKCSLDVLSNEFGLENGKSKLENYFEDIQVEKYPDHLEIDKAEPIINYVLSFGKNKAFLVIKKLNH